MGNEEKVKKVKKDNEFMKELFAVSDEQNKKFDPIIQKEVFNSPQNLLELKKSYKEKLIEIRKNDPERYEQIKLNALTYTDNTSNGDIYGIIFVVLFFTIVPFMDVSKNDTLFIINLVCIFLVGVITLVASIKYTPRKERKAVHCKIIALVADEIEKGI